MYPKNLKLKVIYVLIFNHYTLTLPMTNKDKSDKGWLTAETKKVTPNYSPSFIPTQMHVIVLL